MVASHPHSIFGFYPVGNPRNAGVWMPRPARVKLCWAARPCPHKLNASELSIPMRRGLCARASQGAAGIRKVHLVRLFGRASHRCTAATACWLRCSALAAHSLHLAAPGHVVERSNRNDMSDVFVGMCMRPYSSMLVLEQVMSRTAHVQASPGSHYIPCR